MKIKAEWEPQPLQEAQLQMQPNKVVKHMPAM